MNDANEINFNTQMAISDGVGGWKLRVFRLHDNDKRYCIADGSTDNMFGISIENNICFINNVSASVSTWKKVLNSIFEQKESDSSDIELKLDSSKTEDGQELTISNPGFPNKVVAVYSENDTSINLVHATNLEWQKVLIPLLY